MLFEMPDVNRVERGVVRDGVLQVVVLPLGVNLQVTRDDDVVLATLTLGEADAATLAGLVHEVQSNSSGRSTFETLGKLVEGTGRDA